MLVELSRFRVLPGKSERVDEWMETLNRRMGEVLRTLDREKMKLEVIFREMIDGEEYLYWFSIQDESGEQVSDSPFEVDALHVQFHKECLDHVGHCRRDAQPQVVMVPPAVAKVMGWETPGRSAVPFERREIVFRPRSG